MNLLLLLWNYRKLIFIGISIVGLAGVFGYAKYAHDKNIELQRKLDESVAYVNRAEKLFEQMAEEKAAIEKSKENAKKQIKKTASNMVTPEPLLDTIRGLSVD